MGAGYGNTEFFSRQQIRCSSATADVGCTARRESTINSLRPAQSEFDHWLAARGQTYACRFRRDQRLKVQEIQQWSFQKLRLQNGPLNSQQRFLRKNDCPLRHSIHIARELELAQIIQELLFK